MAAAHLEAESDSESWSVLDSPTSENSEDTDIEMVVAGDQGGQDAAPAPGSSSPAPGASAPASRVPRTDRLTVEAV